MAPKRLRKLSKGHTALQPLGEHKGGPALSAEKAAEWKELMKKKRKQKRESILN